MQNAISARSICVRKKGLCQLFARLCESWMSSQGYDHSENYASENNSLAEHPDKTIL